MRSKTAPALAQPLLPGGDVAAAAVTLTTSYRTRKAQWEQLHTVEAASTFSIEALHLTGVSSIAHIASTGVALLRMIAIVHEAVLNIGTMKDPRGLSPAIIAVTVDRHARLTELTSADDRDRAQSVYL